MSSLPEAPVQSWVLKHGEHDVRAARMSSQLTETPFAPLGVADARLVDPVLEAAVTEAENAARARGFKAGYAAGLRQGADEARARAAEEARERLEVTQREARQRTAYMEAFTQNVGREVERVLQVQESSVDDVRRVVAEMAVELAEALVGHHLTIDDCAARDAVLRALREVPTNASVVLRVHPDDVEEVLNLSGSFTDWEIVKVFADEDVERGGCIAVSQNLEVDARMTRAIMRVRMALDS